MRETPKRVKRRNIISLIAGLLMSPLILPIIVIKAVVGIIKMPFQLKKTYKAVKNHYPEHFKDK